MWKYAGAEARLLVYGDSFISHFCHRTNIEFQVSYYYYILFIYSFTILLLIYRINYIKFITVIISNI